MFGKLSIKREGGEKKFCHKGREQVHAQTIPMKNLLVGLSDLSPLHSVCWVTHQSSSSPSLPGKKEKQNKPTNTTFVLATGKVTVLHLPEAQEHRRGTGLSWWFQRPRRALPEGWGYTERLGGLGVWRRSLYPPSGSGCLVMEHGSQGYKQQSFSKHSPQVLPGSFQVSSPGQ